MPPPGARPPAPGMPPPGARPPGAGAAPPAARPPAAAPPRAAAPTRPAAPPPAARRDPFGFGVGAPAKAPPPPAAPRAEEDFGDIDVEATPAVAAPPPSEPSVELDTGVASAAIELPPEPAGEPELAPMHAFVPPAAEVGHRPSAPAAPPRDGGEALLREALSKASLEVIEKVVWEVVPQLAETIIRENLEKLVAKRQG